MIRIPVRKILLLWCSLQTLLPGAERPVSRLELSYAEEYELRELAQNAADLNRAAPEKGVVRFRRVGNVLCVNVTTDDLDCVSRSTAGQQPLHGMGDTVRLFLQPEGHTQLWELQVDCNNHFSVFFHWGGGRIFYPEHGGTPQAAAGGFSADRKQDNGNSSTTARRETTPGAPSSDFGGTAPGVFALPGCRAHAEKTASGWQCRLEVPLDEAARQLGLADAVGWRVMVMRYNYGKNHPRRDVSSFPQAVRVIPDVERFASLPRP